MQILFRNTVLPISTASHRRSITIALITVSCVCYFMTLGPQGAYLSSKILSTEQSIYKDSTGVLGVEQMDEALLDLAPSAESKPSHSFGNIIPHDPSTSHRANATLLMLARNSDLDGVISSVEQLEAKFNRKFNYPWVFLNDEPFSYEFKRRVKVLTNGDVSFGLIPHETWVQPPWIDEERAERGRNMLTQDDVIYGDSVSYRNMCRFNSGFFFRHELLTPYKWYWRVEPDVRFYCDLEYDPFVFMEDHDKIYGFTISMPEWESTIISLWSVVKEFILDHPEYVSPNNSMGFISDDAGDSYNMCHCKNCSISCWEKSLLPLTQFGQTLKLPIWTSGGAKLTQNSLTISRIQEGFTMRQVKYLSCSCHPDRTQRWGDAPVHSIAAALFTRKDQLHFFKDIGYKHAEFAHCPQGRQWREGHCSCNPNDSFDFAENSCLRHFMRLDDDWMFG
ncbi:glycosyltransferase family 15 protein [Suillus discolor]|uniref:Glycosyltransferase family 15 protein n=1 Tax=Suillus discolor TaxID=1912936 RepID=A0A9P7F9N7_9AGAM|nr:glycosyltransferase family 15 protein [Suillus discolor]KAG2109854.1 glycosyltransferase family 15 protein [Suillus discolor]